MSEANTGATMKTKSVPVLLYALGGSVIGYFLGYMLLIDVFAQMGASMFWAAVRNGSAAEMNLEVLFQSATFWKLLFSTLSGAVVGFYLGLRRGATKSTPQS